MDYATVIEAPRYAFLREEEHLGKNIILLALSGSRSYGTNVPGSDIDIRGITVEKPEEVLGFHDFLAFTDPETDTTIWGLRHAMRLLSKCTPGCIDLLGSRPDHIISVSKQGQMLIDNRKIFLSKIAYEAFMGACKKSLKQAEKRALENGAEERKRVDKALMHQIRLRMTLLDILEKEEIITWRGAERDYLMEIRSGRFTSMKGQILPEFYVLLNNWDKRLAYAKSATSLPSCSDYEAIEEMLIQIYRETLLK